MIRELLIGLAFMTFLPDASLAQWREPPRTMQPAQQRYTDCRAVDGDTLACRQGRVRLRGVDTRSVAKVVTAPPSKSCDGGHPEVP